MVYKLLVSRPKRKTVGSLEQVVGYEYRVVPLPDNERLVLDADEKIMEVLSA